MAAEILIIDDDDAVAGVLSRSLERSGHQSVTCSSLAQGQAFCEADDPEVVLLDYQLPDGTAMDFLHWLQQQERRPQVVVLTGYGTIPLAVEAIKLGADQFLTKPPDLRSLAVLVERLIERNRDARTRTAQRHIQERQRVDPFVGRSAAIQRVAELARSVAASDASVLLLGETGTGKGVLARWLHEQGGRAGEAFVDLNCAGLSRELAESELFGHKRGAFTGAMADKLGLMELAHQGTLFLDEIGDLDPAVQPKLLKALEDRSLRRIGDTRQRPVDVRLISATHRHIGRMASTGAFRADLLYRINTVTIELPPLRERRDDILPMAEAILASLPRPEPGRGMVLTPEAATLLRAHHWPGNAREMRNVLERALLFSHTREIPAGALMLQQQAQGEPGAPTSLADAERTLVLDTLRAHQGNVPLAALALGVPRSSLYAKLKRWNLKATDA